MTTCTSTEIVDPSAGVTSLTVSPSSRSARGGTAVLVAVFVKVAVGVRVAVHVLVTEGVGVRVAAHVLVAVRVGVNVCVGGSGVFVAGTTVGGTNVLVGSGGTAVNVLVGASVGGLLVFVGIGLSVAVTGAFTTTNAEIES